MFIRLLRIFAQITISELKPPIREAGMLLLSEIYFLRSFLSYAEF